MRPRWVCLCRCAGIRQQRKRQKAHTRNRPADDARQSSSNHAVLTALLEGSRSDAHLPEQSWIGEGVVELPSAIQANCRSFVKPGKGLCLEGECLGKYRMHVSGIVLWSSKLAANATD